MAQMEDGLVLHLIGSAGTKEKAVLAKASILEEEEEKKEGQMEGVVHQNKAERFEFSKQIILKDDFMKGMHGVIILPSGKELKIQIIPKLVENPPIGILLKSRLTLMNKLIFEAIQEIQKENRTISN